MPPLEVEIDGYPFDSVSLQLLLQDRSSNRLTLRPAQRNPEILDLRVDRAVVGRITRCVGLIDRILGGGPPIRCGRPAIRCGRPTGPGPARAFSALGGGVLLVPVLCQLGSA